MHVFQAKSGGAWKISAPYLNDLFTCLSACLQHDRQRTSILWSLWPRQLLNVRFPLETFFSASRLPLFLPSSNGLHYLRYFLRFCHRDTGLAGCDDGRIPEKWSTSYTYGVVIRRVRTSVAKCMFISMDMDFASVDHPSSKIELNTKLSLSIEKYSGYLQLELQLLFNGRTVKLWIGSAIWNSAQERKRQKQKENKGMPITAQSISQSSEPVLHAELTDQCFVSLFTHIWYGFTHYTEHFQKSQWKHTEIFRARSEITTKNSINICKYVTQAVQISRLLEDNSWVMVDIESWVRWLWHLEVTIKKGVSEQRKIEKNGFLTMWVSSFDLAFSSKYNITHAWPVRQSMKGRWMSKLS